MVREQHEGWMQLYYRIGGLRRALYSYLLYRCQFFLQCLFFALFLRMSELKFYISASGANNFFTANRLR